MREYGKQMRYARTDLACEWGRRRGACGEETGFVRREWRWHGGRVQLLRVVSSEAAKAIGRAQGSYMTVTCEPIWQLGVSERHLLERVLAGQLDRLLSPYLCGKAESSILVVGLGNRAITADAVGPLTVDRVPATRHLRVEEPELYAHMRSRSVSVLSPGVLGQTGIETGESIAGAVRQCRPDAVLVIDALAARSCERLATTVQLSDTGISPGAGIGNDRRALTKETLGVPVIALGIPTVVDSSALVYDALRRAEIAQIDERLEHILENGRRFYVSPKEADLIVERTASILSHAINRVLFGAAEPV